MPSLKRAFWQSAGGTLNESRIRKIMTVYNVFALLGGVGLFLFGMSTMSAGLKNAAGDQLRVILEHATSNRFVAFLVGIAMTVLIQSSSATDMMVIGFVNSGLMSLSQAVGVIMGANIGTTITAQITAFNLSAFAPIILFSGIVMCLFFKKNLIKNIGSIVMGFGMLFFGISTIGDAIAPLAESEKFISILSTLNNPFLAVLFGIVFTAILQSSSSATVIFQTFAMQGLLSYEMTVYLVIGAAIGAVTPNILASLTTNRNGKRVALMNLLVNLFRAALLIILINIFPQILTFIQNLSPGNIQRQVANTHTIFAVFSMLVELPFAGYIVKLSQKIIKVKPEEKKKLEGRKLQYMTASGSLPPAVALSQARLEIARMGHIARENLGNALTCFFTLDDEMAADVEDVEDTVNYLTHEITNRLGQLRSLDMSEKERMQVSQMTLVVSDMERLSDHAENIVEYEAQIKNKKARLSPVAVKELKELSEASLASVDLCIDIFEHQSSEKIPLAYELEAKVDDLQSKIVQNHVNRLMNNECEPMGGVIFTDMSIDLERCSDHAINIATALTEEK